MTEHERAVCEAYARGVYVRTILKECGISFNELYHIVDKHNCPRRGTYRSGARDRAISEAYRAGERVAAIAKRFGISRSTVTRAVKRMDVPLRHGGRKPPMPDFAVREEQIRCARCKILLEETDAGWGITTEDEPKRLCGDCVLEAGRVVVWQVQPDERWQGAICVSSS